jgi:hypothetical protein
MKRFWEVSHRGYPKVLGAQWVDLARLDRDLREAIALQ